MDAKHILIVDDDEAMVATLEATLMGEGYSVAVAHNDEECRAQVEERSPDLVILDINLNLPGINGLDLCRELRQSVSAPILMLSGSDDDVDKIVALELGATNYLTKPVSPRVLLSFVRRTFSLGISGDVVEEEVEPGSPTLHFNNFVLNLDAFTLCTEDGEDIPITPAEFKVLRLFAQRPRCVLTREQIADCVNVDSDVYERSMDRFIGRLRRKIEVDYKKPALLKSIYGEGYLLDTTVVKKNR